MGPGVSRLAMTAVTLWRCALPTPVVPTGWWGWGGVVVCRYLGNRTVDASANVTLVSPYHKWWGVCLSLRRISTGQLHTLLCFHIRPINPVFWLGASRGTRSSRKSHLEAGFPLRCFQRLSLPNVANQPCSWRNNWHTRGWSVPV